MCEWLGLPVQPARQGPDLGSADPPRKGHAPSSGGIRASTVSDDIVLVHDAHTDFDGVELGKHIRHDGTYGEGLPDQMVGANLKLAKSRENGSRVLYFSKERGVFRFDGLVECVGFHDKDDPSRPGALVFDLEPAVALAAGHQGGRAGRHGGQHASRTPSAPDLDMIVAVERKIYEHGPFASILDLRAALDGRIGPAQLGLVLEYLEGSAKIHTGGGYIRWTFNGGGPRGGQNTGGVGCGAPPALDTNKGATGAPGAAEGRRPEDLDDDRPFSAEIERMIADCEAGRPIGKTYTAEEYLRHLDREYGNGDLGHPRK